MHSRLSWSIALASLALTHPLGAQSKPLSAADLFSFETAADAQISPDGQWVAYVRRWSDAATDKRYRACGW